MAITAKAIWRIRTGGSDNNGAGYDSDLATPGTSVDYSAFDSAILTLPDLACAANTQVLTSATGGFTPAMVGNAIRIRSGTNWTVGFYFITGFTDSNTVTIDRIAHATLAASGGVGNVGGAGTIGGTTSTLAVLLASANAAGNKAVNGNVVYVRGSGTNDPTSVDYTLTASITGTFNSSTLSTVVAVIGDNGRPRLRISNGGTLYQINATGINFSGIYFDTGYSGGATANPLILLSRGVMRNCVVDCQSKSIQGVQLGTYGFLVDTLVSGFSTTQTSGTLYHGVVIASNLSCVHGCVVRNFRGSGIVATSLQGVTAIQNLIYGCGQHGITSRNDNTSPFTLIFGNVIKGQGVANTYGIYLQGGALAQSVSICNNVITDFSGTGSVGIASTDTAFYQAYRPIMDNAFWNNTANYDANVKPLGLDAGDVQLTASPFASATDFTANSTAGAGALLKGAGFPATLPGTSTAVWSSIGFVAAPTGGSTLVIVPNAPKHIGA